MRLKDWELRVGRNLWPRHPGVRTGEELTIGERAADRLRNGMGSWGFVFAALLFLAGWMAGNRGVGFDPYPFILLNLILSCVAALQGAILLIAARRSDQISAELATHDYQTNVDAAQMIEAIEAMTGEIHRHIVTSAITSTVTSTGTSTVTGTVVKTDTEDER
ncbi:MAG: DUF1003 domain-containing protein [Acidimicrobiales bacterium]